MLRIRPRRHRYILGGICIAVGTIITLCFIPLWIWLVLVGLALALFGVLCIIC